jgi:hypothetical protein
MAGEKIKGEFDLTTTERMHHGDEDSGRFRANSKNSRLMKIGDPA